MEGEAETGAKKEGAEEDERNCSSLELTELSKSFYETLTGVKSLNLKYNDLKVVPDEFCTNLSSTVTHLYLKGNKLEFLPNSFGILTHLKTLDASENRLRKLPDSFTLLTKLETLKLVSNRLRTGFLMTVESFTSLQHLHLDENRLKFLPSSFGRLERLATLEVANNKLKSLPADIGNLRYLKCLNVSNNRIVTLPESIQICPNIEELDVSYNNIKFLPDNLLSASRLKKFYADRNLLCALPSWFNNFKCLEELSLENNQLQGVPFPDSFGSTTPNLRHFNLGGNFVCQLPHTFGEMKLLEFVHFGSIIDELERRDFQNGNWLVTLPTNFGYLINVKHLRLDENQLVELPESFGQLVSLVTLDLGQNKLRKLPESFSRLRSLQTCLLSKNFLEILPKDFGSLESLVELRLDNNLLTELPKSFDKLTQLTVLDLFNNKLTSFPNCLPFLTKLKYLELEENDFETSMDEIPRMMFNVSYATRNPEMKNNWRGKNRRNILEDELNDAEEKLNSIKSLNVNGLQTDQINRLTLALKQGSAIWRTHGENNPRDTFDHSKVQPKEMWSANDINGKNDETLERESSDDSSSSSSSYDEDKVWSKEDWTKEACEMDVSLDANNTLNSTEDNNLEILSAGEDWDKEMDNSNPFHVYGTKIQIKSSESKKEKRRLISLEKRMELVSSKEMKSLMPVDWHTRNTRTSYLTSEMVKEADRLGLESRILREQVAKNAQNYQTESTKHLKLSSERIRLLRESLEQGIQTAIHELDLINEDRNRLLQAINVLSNVKHLNDTCLGYRRRRPSLDLIRDSVDIELTKEQESIYHGIILLHEMLNATDKQIRHNHESKRNLEFDWSNKVQNYNLEVLNVDLVRYPQMGQQCSNCLAPQKTYTDEETWYESTWANIKESLRVWEMSQETRHHVGQCLKDLSCDIRKQADVTDNAFNQRILELETSQTELLKCDKQTQLKMGHLEKTLEELQREKQKMKSPMTVAQTRFHCRSYRPLPETYEDSAQQRLKYEVDKLTNSIEQLIIKESETEETLNRLRELHHRLIKDINTRKQSIFIDKDKCMPLRSTFPDSVKLAGYY